MVTRIKICGITRLEDALAAAAAGASAVGFVFANSPRTIEPGAAKDIANGLPPYLERVGVFVNTPLPQIERIRRDVGLTQIQLHGDETPAGYRELPCPLTRALSMEDPALEQTAEQWRRERQDCHLLVDLPRNPNQAESLHQRWQKLAMLATRFPLILAGGLDLDNVFSALQAVRPAAVDVSRGVETAPGIKDSERIQAFCQAVRSFDATQEGAV